MIYQYVSIQSVIARIVANTRLTDTSYLFDMREWIPQAMGYMRTKYELSTKYKDVEIYFHRGELPCDLHHIKAVEHCGKRLPELAASRSIDQQSIRTTDEVALISTLQPTTTPTGNVRWESKFCPDLETACALAYSYHHYTTEMGFIGTSFPDGIVRVHYAAIPCDEDGLPLIPDNEDYKQALYYYVRAMMVGTGFKDPVFREELLMARFELHARRAMGQIRYPSVDSMGQKVKNQVRFVPPANYFDNFFQGGAAEGNF